MKQIISFFLITSIALTIVFPTRTYAATDIVNDATLSTSLLSCWDLDEASGIRTDEAGSNHLDDFFTTGSETGVVDDAASMVRANTEGLYRDSENPDLSVASGDYSIATWVKLASEPSGGQMSLVSKYKATNGKREYILYWYDAGGGDQKFYWYVSDATTGFNSVTATSLGNTSTGVWYFIYAYIDQGNNIGISVNDGTVDTTSLTITTHDGTGPFSLGFNSEHGVDNANHFDGAQDVTAIWNKQLSSAEVTALYNSGSGIPCVAAGDSGGGTNFSQVI